MGRKSIPETSMLKSVEVSQYGKGFLADPEKVRLAKPSMKMLLGAPYRLPHTFMELVQVTPPMRNQVHTSACTGFAKWRCIDTRLAYLNIPFEPHSPGGIYKLTRCVERVDYNEPLTDDGAYPSDVQRAINDWGCPTEAVMPFDPETINSEPALDQVEDAARLHIDEDYSLDSDNIVEEVRHSLVSGYPVFMGTAVDRAFEKYNGEGIIEPATDDIIGGHATCILGYEGEEFVVANSWGERWGKWGFYRVKAEYLEDRRARGNFSACAISMQAAKPKKRTTDAGIGEVTL